MPRVAIHLPSMLAAAVGQATLHVDADRLSAALAAFRKDHPRAATHIYDDAGRQRRHVLIFLNDRDTKWLADPDPLLDPGDVLSVVQAISGG